MAKAQEKPATRPLDIDTSTAALALAGLTIVAALAIGFTAGIGMALLAILTGALLGAILLVWHSLRTLAGDAEVDVALETAARSPANIELSGIKNRALRALKDLEQEHALGKIDDADFAKLDAEYREQAKEAIRALDEDVAPFREKAEALVREHLAKHPIKEEPPATPDDADDDEDEDDANVIECPKCATHNDPDATFCKKCGEKLA